MTSITITPAAFEAIVATLPIGSVGYKPQRDAKGNYVIHVETVGLEAMAGR
jgi:hypothetical protein